MLSLLAIACGVNSATIQPGSLGVIGPSSGPTDPDILFFDQTFDAGIVDDIFLFDIETGGLPSAAAASITSISMTSVFSNFGPVQVLGIQNFEFALTDEFGGLLTGFVGTGQSVEINPITNGTYGIWLRGNATGLAGGAVAGPIALSAVPIPAAVWLFGSALIGLFGIRRSKEITPS